MTEKKPRSRMGKLLSPETLDALRAFDTATISNAIEAFKVRDPTDGYASMELRCQFPDLTPIVGYAVTATVNTTSPGPVRVDRLHDLLDTLRAAPKPAIVVIQHIGPDRLRSCVAGDLISATYQKLGAVGFVTDGGIRDLSGIRRRVPGFQVFAPGLVPSHGTAATIEVGVTVSICGLTIQPGDLLHGDENGLITVPLDIAESVAEQAQKVFNKEQELFDLLNSSSCTYEALKRRLGHQAAE